MIDLETILKLLVRAHKCLESDMNDPKIKSLIEDSLSENEDIENDINNIKKSALEIEALILEMENTDNKLRKDKLLEKLTSELLNPKISVQNLTNSTDNCREYITDFIIRFRSADSKFE